jgi:hypothetical protein
MQALYHPNVDRSTHNKRKRQARENWENLTGVFVGTEKGENGNFSAPYRIFLSHFSLFSDMRQSLINIWRSDRTQGVRWSEATKPIKKPCVP